MEFKNNKTVNQQSKTIDSIIIDQAVTSYQSLDHLRICRICLSNQKQLQSSLITPCNCSGSLQFVHKQCYFKWIQHLYHRLETSEEKEKMETQGFYCEICKINIKVDFENQRVCVNTVEFGQICKDSIPLTITIIVFFLIATAAFSYLVYFADLTKQQFAKQNGAQAFFTVLSIIIIIVFFSAGMYFFITKYLWVERIKVSSINPDIEVIKRQSSASNQN